MGFDNECIVNIQSLAGEYFCPVCRLLVYPNEAIQSQCTHLYCKPCLTYVVGTTRACPYDGYLVTEADSKPLIESNKALAETIGNIAVHCLYHRSGCTWQGPLSECTSHCSGCAFGNSPVVCNRCGVQIVHRQVQEHAQTCPGVQPQTQQALSASDTSATGTATAADPSQAAAQSVTPSSQAQTTQATVAPPPGQDPNQQSSGNPQAQAVAPAAAPTPEQWYQQQYQQYYQQYPGYDPYQQTYQHSYPYQQQAVQPYQQHAQHVQGQHQPQVYTQPQAQPPLQPQPQAQVQPQVQPQSQSQSQSQPHAPPQPHQNIQVPVAAQHQNQAQGNLQQQVHPPIQMQSQTHAPPHGHPHTQPHPQSYPQGQPLPHLVQMPQYQQPPPQMQHPQPPIQPQHHSLPQPPAHSLGQPQGHVQHQPHSHPQINPPLQPNQPPNTNAHPQTQQPSVHTVTGHQSYPQPQAVQQIQLGAPQHPVQVQGGPPPQHPTQLHNQFPQQPPQLRPPQSHTPIQNQQHSALLPLQGQPGQQMLHPHSQQPGQPVQQRPVMQPIQPSVPQQFMQQQPFPGQTSGPVQNQLHQQAHLTPPPPPPPMQSHLRPPPHSYMQSQQNVIHAPQPQQSQNYIGRPMMSNHGAQSQPFPQPTSGFTGPAQVRPMQFGSNPQSANLNHLPRTNNQPLVSSEQQNFQSGMALKPPMFERQGDHMSKSVAEREAGLPSQITAKTDANGLVPIGVGADKVEARTLKSEVDLKFSESEQKPRGGDKHGTQHVDTLAKDTDSKLHAVENGSGEPAIKSMVKKEGTEGTVEPSLGGSATVVKEQKDSTDFPKLADQSDSLEEHSDKLPKDAVDESMPVSTGADKGSHDIPLAHARVPDSSVHDVAPQGNSQTTPTGRDPLQHGFQERNMFQSQIAPQGPGVDEPRGFPPQGHGFPHQQPPMHYGPPTHQQRPAAPPLRPLHQGYGPAQPPSMLRPQVPGEFSHPGPPLNPADHFQTPMKQPYGSFPPEVPSGGNLGPGSTSSFGRGPTHFGPPQGNFELESSAPLGHYNHGRGPPSHVGGGPPPGSFDPHGGIMGRVPPHGPDGQFVQQRPNSQMEAEMFPDQRSRNFDGRRIDSHLPGTWEKGPLGQPPGIDSNAMRMKLAPGIDSSSTLGYGDERFKPPPEEQFNPFPLEPARRLERGSRPHDKAPFGDNYDAGSGGAPSRFLPSYHSPGTFHPNEAGERVRPFGPDDNFGRADNSRTHPDFLKPAAGFGRHHMDRLTPRSPGREYPSIPPRGFGGVPRRQSGVDDIDGGQSRPPFGEGFHGSRFPLSPSHLRRGDHDGPGILRGGDFTEQDILPSHLRRGEMLSHQNLPGHLRFGDPSGFGVFPSGPGNLPHSFPPGESFGGKKSSHPRLGEPGFRSSYSLQGFPNDGGFFTSNMDSIDNSRKRKPTSMGWCRICRVDCETVEGLDMHSQTREHQKKTMDMVLSIKQQNAKRQKKSNDRSAREEASKSRGAVYEGRGNKA